MRRPSLPVVALAQDQVAGQVEGQPVGTAAIVAVDRSLPVRGHPVHQRGANVHEQPVAVGMPQRPFSKTEASGKLLRFRA